MAGLPVVATVDEASTLQSVLVHCSGIRARDSVSRRRVFMKQGLDARKSALDNLPLV